MKLKEIVISKMNNPNLTDIEIEIAILETEEVIKNYCNIDIIPQELKFTWANMTTDLLRYQYEMNNPQSNDDILNSFGTADISELKVGDTQIGVGGNNSVSAKALNSHKANLDALIFDYQSQLNRFRKMVDRKSVV